MADVTLAAKLTADTREFVSKMKGATGQVDKTRQSIMSASNILKGVFVGGVGAASFSLVKLASDAEETGSKFNTVFKDAAGEVRQWAKETAQATNRSAVDLEGFLATLQDTFVPLGFARDKAADMSKAVTQLAVDLGSFNNLPTEQVVADLQSALVGNTETLRKYGVVANQAAIDQKALAMGLQFTKGKMDAQTKAAAIMQLALDGTTDAQGDAIKTSDSFANQLRGLQAELEDVGRTIGNYLMPIFKNWIGTARLMLTGIAKVRQEFMLWKNQGTIDELNEQISENIQTMQRWQGMGFDTSKKYKQLFEQTKALNEQVSELSGELLVSAEALEAVEAQVDRLISANKELAGNPTSISGGGGGPAGDAVAASIKANDEMGEALNKALQLGQFRTNITLDIFAGDVSGFANTMAEQFGSASVGFFTQAAGPIISAMSLEGDQARQELEKLFTGFASSLINIAGNFDALFESVIGSLGNIFTNIFDALKSDGTKGGRRRKGLRVFAAFATGGLSELSGGATAASNIVKRAGGGPVTKGQPTLVGERGPELLVPKSAGTVIPNNQLGGGGVVANITIVADRNPNVTAQMVEQALMRLSRQGRLAVNPVTGVGR